MFMQKINNKMTQFKWDQDAIQRLDSEAHNTKINGSEADGVKAGVFVTILFEMLGIEDTKSEETVDSEPDYNMFRLYFDAIFYSLQSNFTRSKITGWLDAQSDEELNDIVQKTVDELRGNAKKGFSIK
jgi:hypothetical protein